MTKPETASGRLTDKLARNLSDTISIALYQHAPTPLNIDASLARIDTQAGKAATAGASLLVLPEASLTGYNVPPEKAQKVATPVDGDTFARLADCCRRHDIAVLVGFIERDGDMLYNAVRLLDRHGDAIGAYRKTHLWNSLDRSLFQAGATPSPIIDWNGWRTGFLICYDVEFPEAVRQLALAGAELVLVPTALMHPFTFVADHVTRVRAAENGIFLAYANYCGSENGLDYAGHSVIVAPDGQELARADDQPALLLATLDRQAISAARAALPYLAERRPTLYATCPLHEFDR